MRSSWRKVSGTVALPAGTYRFVANIHDDGNFDAAYVQAEAAVCICDGNGQIDNNHDGLPDCKKPPAFADILPAWKCGNNNQKVQVCHKGNTLCIAYSALAAHIAHGDYFGPCGTMTCNTVPQINPQSGSRPTSQAGFSVKTYPNPFDKDLTVAVSIDKQAAIQIELIDLLGRQIYRSNTFYTEGVLSVPIAIKGLPNGTYFLKVSNGQEVIQQKVIKN